MNLSAPEKRRAGAALEATIRDYTKSGGVRDLESRLADAHTSCSAHIFALAQFASKASKSLAEAVERFSEMCQYAEDGYKKRHETENLKDVLPVWPVYKSNILRGMRMNLNPADYKSEGAFRTAREDEARARGPQIIHDQQSNAPEPHPLRTVEDAETIMGATTIRSNLQVLIARLLVEAEYIRKGNEDEAERIVEEAVIALSRLVDKRRIKDAATRQALGEVA